MITFRNYGYTSSGWSLTPGSTQYLIDLFNSQAKKWELQKHMPIAIIGAGISGLYTAYALQKSGYNYIKIISEKFNNLTSHHAGGLFAPPFAVVSQAKIKNIAINSYKFYRAIADKVHTDFKDGATVMPAYFKNIMANYTPLVNEKIIQPPKSVTLDFGNSIRREVIAYDESIFIDVDKMMTNLHTFLSKHTHITFEQKKLHLLMTLMKNLSVIVLDLVP